MNDGNDEEFIAEVGLDSRRDALERKLDELARLTEHPSLYVSEYFYLVRNEIDLRAEQLIIDSINKQQRSYKYDRATTDPVAASADYDEIDDIYDDDSDDADCDCDGIRDDTDDDDHPKKPPKSTRQRPHESDLIINKIRELMIDTLNVNEKRCLNQIQKSTLRESKRRYNELKERLQVYATEAMNTYDLDEGYEAMQLAIEEAMDEFKRELLLNKSFIFKATNKNGFGLLIVFEDNYLSEPEIECLK